VVKAALAEKLLVAGASDNVVRLLPPLNVADEEIAEATHRLSRALDRVSASAT
jgi:acetylornithine/N-succinyldiaminopimelate aminotransferase